MENLVSSSPTLTLMPKRLVRLGRTSGKYTFSDEVYVLQIYRGDDPLLQCTLRNESTPAQCMCYLRQRLSLRQQWELFSFRFLQRPAASPCADSERKQWRWVEMDKPLRRQLEKWGCRPRQVHLALLYHTPNAFSLSDQTARGLYYALLKYDLLSGQLRGVDVEKCVTLAAFSLQVEQGNYDAEVHTSEWLRSQTLLPARMLATLHKDGHAVDEALTQVVTLYERLRGMTPSYAAFLYIVDAQQCDGYGEEYWPAKDDEGMEVRLGYTLEEVFALRLATGTRLRLPWAEVKAIQQMAKRNLQISSRPNAAGLPEALSPDGEGTPTVVGEQGRVAAKEGKKGGKDATKKTTRVTFTLEDAAMAKYVCRVLAWQWRFAITETPQHRAAPMSISNLQGDIRDHSSFPLAQSPSSPFTRPHMLRGGAWLEGTPRVGQRRLPSLGGQCSSSNRTAASSFESSIPAVSASTLLSTSLMAVNQQQQLGKTNGYSNCYAATALATPRTPPRRQDRNIGVGSAAARVLRDKARSMFNVSHVGGGGATTATSASKARNDQEQPTLLDEPLSVQCCQRLTVGSIAQPLHTALSHPQLYGNNVQGKTARTSTANNHQTQPLQNTASTTAHVTRPSPINRPSSASSSSQPQQAHQTRLQVQQRQHQRQQRILQPAKSFCAIPQQQQMSRLQPTPAHLREGQREILRQMLAEKRRLLEEGTLQTAAGELSTGGGVVAGSRKSDSSPEIHMTGVVAKVAGSQGKALFGAHHYLTHMLLKKVVSTSPHFLHQQQLQSVKASQAKAAASAGVGERGGIGGAVVQSSSGRCGPKEGTAGSLGSDNGSSSTTHTNQQQQQRLSNEHDSSICPSMWRSTPELYGNSSSKHAGLCSPITHHAQQYPPSYVPPSTSAAGASKFPRPQRRRNRYARHTAEIHPMMMAAAAEKMLSTSTVNTDRAKLQSEAVSNKGVGQPSRSSPNGSSQLPPQQPQSQQQLPKMASQPPGYTTASVVVTAPSHHPFAHGRLVKQASVMTTSSSAASSPSSVGGKFFGGGGEVSSVPSATGSGGHNSQEQAGDDDFFYEEDEAEEEEEGISEISEGEEEEGEKDVVGSDDRNEDNSNFLRDGLPPSAAMGIEEKIITTTTITTIGNRIGLGAGRRMVLPLPPPVLRFPAPPCVSPPPPIIAPASPPSVMLNGTRAAMQHGYSQGHLITANGEAQPMLINYPLPKSVLKKQQRHSYAIPTTAAASVESEASSPAAPYDAASHTTRPTYCRRMSMVEGSLNHKTATHEEGRFVESWMPPPSSPPPPPPVNFAAPTYVNLLPREDVQKIPTQHSTAVQPSLTLATAAEEHSSRGDHGEIGDNLAYSAAKNSSQQHLEEPPQPSPSSMLRFAVCNTHHQQQLPYEEHRRNGYSNGSDGMNGTSSKNILLNGVAAAAVSISTPPTASPPSSSHSAQDSPNELRAKKSDSHAVSSRNEGQSLQPALHSATLLAALRKKLSSPGLLEREFTTTPTRRLSAGFSTAQRVENQHLNRSVLSRTSSSSSASSSLSNGGRGQQVRSNSDPLQSIYPYEDTRVMLHPSRHNPDGYINASNVQYPLCFTDGGELDSPPPATPLQRYIITQAPMRQTTDDFWQMVWESGALLIVMLVNPHQAQSSPSSDSTTPLVPQYWPSGGGGGSVGKDEMHIEHFVLRLKSCSRTPVQTTSVLSMRSLARGERRLIYHLQFSDFSVDRMGVPTSHDSFMGFIDAVNSVKRYVGNELAGQLERHESDSYYGRRLSASGRRYSLTSYRYNLSNASGGDEHSVSEHVPTTPKRTALVSPDKKIPLSERKRRRTRSKSIGRVSLSEFTDRIRGAVTSAVSHQSLVESGAALMKRLSIGGTSIASAATNASHCSSSDSPPSIANGIIGNEPTSRFHVGQLSSGGVVNGDSTSTPARLLLRRASSIRKREEPLTIVHCTDGASESGLFVLSEVLIQCIENNENAIDVAQVLRSLRQQRMGLVRSADQYRFVHELLAGYLEKSRLI